MNKLKFNVLEKTGDNSKTPLENFLINKGIEFPEKFLDPMKYVDEFYTMPEQLHSIHEAVSLVLEAVYERKNIGILVDDDADGYTSASAMTRYLKDFQGHVDNVKWYFHENKSHGLSSKIMEEILNGDEDLIIIPDAASNDFDEQRKILDSGRKLLILDHHMVDNQNEIKKIEEEHPYRYALVNNQLEANEGEVNKEFTGAGVVYKLCEMIDQEQGFNYSDNICDLVATGQIADASNIADYEIRHMVVGGLETLSSPILKFMFDDKLSKGEIIAPINLSFSIIPIINAISRIGTKEDKELIMKSLSGYWPEDQVEIVKRRRKNKITGKFVQVDLEWSMYELAHDELKKIKAKQDKIVNNTKKEMKNYEDVGMVSIIVTPEDLVEFRSTTGLIANKIASENMTPALVLIDKENSDILSGSARGYEGTFKDFRTWCLNTGLFKLAQGHDNAFGVEITRENAKKLVELSNEDYEYTEPVYDVDKLFYNETNIEEVKTINELEHIFGGNVPSPSYGYENLIISRKSVSQRGTVVTFFHEGLEFVAYKQENGIIDDLMATAGFNQYLSVDLIGRPSKNEWTGRVKHQIVLQDYTINVLNDNDVELNKSWEDETGELSF